MSTTASTASKISFLNANSPKLKANINSITQQVVIPFIGIVVFLFLWSAAAQSIDTSLGKFPGPGAVYEQFKTLYQEHNAERKKEEAFYERQKKRNAERVKADPDYKPKIRAYTGKETFLDQIFYQLDNRNVGFYCSRIDCDTLRYCDRFK